MLKISRSFEKNVSVGQFLFEKFSASYEETCDDDCEGQKLCSELLYASAKNDVLKAIEQRQKELKEQTVIKEIEKESKENREAKIAATRKRFQGKMDIKSQNVKNYKEKTFREGEMGYEKSNK